MARVSVTIDVTTMTNEELIQLQYEVQNALATRLARGMLPIVVSYEEVMMIKEKNPIAAIKSIRTRYNLGLKEAKDIIDAKRTELGLSWEGQHINGK